MAPPTHPDQDFITERHARYAQAYNSADVDAILSFMSEDIEFCDYGVNTTPLSKPAVRTYFHSMFASCANLSLQTVSVSGHAHFTSWEWNLSFNYMAPLAEATSGASSSSSSSASSSSQELGAGKADGRLVRMIGVSVSWWDGEGEGKGGKIVKNHDYARVVEGFEGR